MKISKLTGTFLLLLAYCCSYAGQQADKPNILWLTFEDVSAYNIGAYGNTGIKTPNIDSLAKNGIQYLNAWSNAPQCSPARSTLITGSYATAYGMDLHPVPVETPNGIFFPTWMAEAGYYTTNNSKTHYNTKADHQAIWNESNAHASYNSTKRQKNQPFFSVFNSTTSHMGRIRTFHMEGRRDYTLEGIHPAQLKIPSYLPALSEMRSDYAAHLEAIQDVDKWVGTILKDLRDKGLADNTIVFVFSDHGGVLPRSKGYLFETGLRVPLIVYVPEKLRDRVEGVYPRKDSSLVNFTDLAPTVLALAGAKSPNKLSGLDILGNSGEAGARKYQFAFGTNQLHHFMPVRAVTNGRYKLIKSYIPYKRNALRNYYQWGMPANKAWDNYVLQTDYSGGNRTGGNRSWYTPYEPTEPEQLFDLKNDPFETNNLINDSKLAIVREQLKEQLKRHLQQSGDVGFFQPHQRQGESIAGYINRLGFPKQVYFDLLEKAPLAQTKDRAFFLKHSDHKEPVIRYWAIVGLVNLAFNNHWQVDHKRIIAEVLRTFRRATEDEDPFIAAEAAFGLFYSGEIEEGLAFLLDRADKQNLPAKLSLVECISLDPAKRNELKKYLPILKQLAAKPDLNNNEDPGLMARGILVNLGEMDIEDMHGSEAYEAGLKFNQGRRGMGPLPYSVKKTVPGNLNYPEFVGFPKPANNIRAKENPPTLFWPLPKNKTDVSYSISISNDIDFPEGGTTEINGIPWAFYRPESSLKTGTWYWRYKSSEWDDNAGDNVSWSETYSFKMDDSVRLEKRLPFKDFVNRIPSNHPRVLLPADSLIAFRRKVRNESEHKELLKRADAFFFQELPTLMTYFPADLPENDSEKKTIVNYNMRRLAFGRREAVLALSQAYLITNEKKYALEAIRWIMPVVDWDPDGLSAVDDFMDGGLLSAMAIVYDSCNEYLTKKQRAALLESIRFRAHRFYLHYVNNVESRLIENHFWQHIYKYLLEASIATLGDTEEAELWLKFLYNLWQARFPVLSEEDGGWANGNHYFGVNYETLIYVPYILGTYSGDNYFDHPWYLNTLDYIIYSMPPKSYSDGFGDGHEVNETPRMNRVGFADMLGRILQDPRGSWYALKNLEGSTSKLIDNHEMQWYRIVYGTRGKGLLTPAIDAPQQWKLFKDIGLTTWHTNIAEPHKNLMISFRSSPFGAFGHAHADQNSFTVNYKGKPLFVKSGYYSSFADKHTLLSYRHTSAANSILANGLGQAIGVEGYGAIESHLAGKEIKYVRGDASHAYKPIASTFINNRFKAMDIEPNEANGFGDAGVKTFKRHLIFLEPGYIVLYDELEAGNPIPWTWMIHSPEMIVKDKKGNQFYVKTPDVMARINIYGSEELRSVISDEFFEPAVNWAKKTKKDPFFSYRIRKAGEEISPAELEDYVNQWHLSVESAAKTGAMRFLSIIQVRDTQELDSSQNDSPGSQTFTTVQQEGDGLFQLGKWRIKVEMDGSKPAFIDIQDLDGKNKLIYNQTHDFELFKSGNARLMELRGK